MDFTLVKYKKLIEALKEQNYAFQTFNGFIISPKEKVAILRHDVDLLPYNSLEFAKIQNSHNIRGSYYFRAVPESWDEKVIKEISGLGHEIGYHYECLTTTNGDLKGTSLPSFPFVASDSAAFRGSSRILSIIAGVRLSKGFRVTTSGTPFSDRPVRP